MKKKQILFLFAASALFAACSSDELPGNTEGGNENGQETPAVTATSISVQTSEGVGMTVGTLDGAATKAGDKGIYVQVPIYNTIADPEGAALLDKWEDHIAKVDDFAIIKNGDYIFSESSESNSADWGSILLSGMAGSTLGLEVTNLESLETSNANTPDIINDYTFQVYIWIDNRQDANDGSGSSVELFTDDNKWEWIGGKDIHEGEDPLVTGYDFSSKFDGFVSFKDDSDPGKDAPVYGGYKGRFNLYRGISGRPTTDGNSNYTSELGDTPYIKISVHVQKQGEEVKTTAQLTPIYPSED